jgi:D-alanyl-D-alanine carboxypeptidase
LSLIVATLAGAHAPADARSPHKHRAEQASADSSNPRYAAIVVDANSGATLRQASADGLRHPASLTKIMTLYLLFERIEAGKLKLNTPLSVSEEAAAQSPTKLGLNAGQIIMVEDAIKALITKSANDAAVVIAEAIAGSEDEFAKLMTRKARTLGMSRTVYRNASGLPDDEQVTTARDQARLGIAIQQRFPRYYRYFSTVNFTYRGNTMRNHNHLLGRVDGVDGIKTGYTHASGFNLVTSVRRGARHIVAVVLGGHSGAQRDAHMRDLIDRHIVEASVKRPALKIAQASSTQASKPAEPTANPRSVAAAVIPAPADTTAAITPRLAPGSHDPINPTSVKTVPIKAAASPFLMPQLTAFAPAPEMAPAQTDTGPSSAVSEARSSIAGAPPVIVSTTKHMSAMGTITEPPVARPPRHVTVPSGWAIQVGAFEQEGEAKQRLTTARNKAADLLGAAGPYTERTSKGDKIYYRARFSGLDRTQAEAVCRQLKQNDIVCMTLKI